MSASRSQYNCRLPVYKKNLFHVPFDPTVSRFHVDLHYMYSFKLFRLKVFAYSLTIRTFYTFLPSVNLLNFLRDSIIAAETLKRMKAGQI
jgi:hypothetical protein